MLFYDYRYCMKKHDIANDTLNFLSDNKDEDFLGGPA